MDDFEIANLLGSEKVNRENDSWGQENQAFLLSNSEAGRIQNEVQPDKGTLIKSNRKRDREEAFGNKLEDATIESVLNNIKGRVLNGETLNNFKKDVN